ncbi:hypothetical protein [Acinetobacter haemolyticus]|nr:hypothetical protein [Acinetobacter haemolyticus]
MLDSCVPVCQPLIAPTTINDSDGGSASLITQGVAHASTYF